MKSQSPQAVPPPAASTPVTAASTSPAETTAVTPPARGLELARGLEGALFDSAATSNSVHPDDVSVGAASRAAAVAAGNRT